MTEVCRSISNNLVSPFPNTIAHLIPLLLQLPYIVNKNIFLFLLPPQSFSHFALVIKMKYKFLPLLLSAAPALINGYLLDDSCLDSKLSSSREDRSNTNQSSTEKFNSKQDGKNLIEKNFDNVFKQLKGINGEFAKEPDSWNQKFKRSFQILYGPLTAGGKGEDALKELKGKHAKTIYAISHTNTLAIERLENTVVTSTKASKMRPLKDHLAPDGKLPFDEDVVIYCDLSRFKEDTATKKWKVSNGHYTDEITDSSYQAWKKWVWDGTRLNSRAWALKANPLKNRPDIIQLNEGWIEYLEATGGFFFENIWWPQTLKNQEEVLPGYKFVDALPPMEKDEANKRKPTATDAAKVPGTEADKVFISTEIGSRMQKTLAHEVFDVLSNHRMPAN